MPPRDRRSRSKSHDSEDQKKVVQLLNNNDEALLPGNNEQIPVVEDDKEEIDLQRKSNNKSNSDNLLLSEVIPEFPNQFIIPEGRADNLIIKVPVVLAQFRVEINCESTIKLDQPMQEIKRVKKNVLLDQCKLLPQADKLFISGYVRKNIEYAALKSKDNKISKNIRHMTVNIPFKCITQVKYFSQPEITMNSMTQEIETNNPDCSYYNASEKHYISHEYFNEKIYCNLISAEIIELDIAEEEDKNIDGTEKVYQSITEKMVVALTLKLIQNQHIKINI